jgi:hypothetical protein
MSTEKESSSFQRFLFQNVNSTSMRDKFVPDYSESIKETNRLQYQSRVMEEEIEKNYETQF